MNYVIVAVLMFLGIIGMVAHQCRADETDFFEDNEYDYELVKEKNSVFFTVK